MIIRVLTNTRVHYKMVVYQIAMGFAPFAV